MQFLLGSQTKPFATKRKHYEFPMIGKDAFFAVRCMLSKGKAA